MHQIHVQDFKWEAHQRGAINGCLCVHYTNSGYTGAVEEYQILVRDPSLVGWDPHEIDAGMLLEFIPSCITSLNSRIRTGSDGKIDVDCIL